MVQITDQAITAIQGAKSQEEVNKALQTALELINQLQGGQPEKPVEPKQPEQPEKPTQPEKPITSSSSEDGVKDLTFKLPSLESVNKVVAHKTIRRENPQLDKGKEKVLVEGKDGLVIEYVEVDGLNRKILHTETTPAQDRVIEIGTKESSVGAEVPPVVAFPEYTLPKNTENPSTVVVTENSAAKDEKTSDETAAIKQDKEKQLPVTGEKDTTVFLFLAAITSILSLLIFQKDFRD
ncbi:G5 domain protein [uncultured Streptococcus sp.]|nr:G5 domain protein [uncultured Streptococcus sp.]